MASDRLLLEELMVMDQFLHCLQENLVIWLQEKKPSSVKEAAELADKYALVRGRMSKSLSGGKPEKRREPTATVHGHNIEKSDHMVLSQS